MAAKTVLFVKTGDEASLKGALVQLGVELAEIVIEKVFPKTILVAIPADKAPAIVALKELDLGEGIKAAVEPSKSKEPKPQAETPKAKPSVPAIPQGPVKVKPTPPAPKPTEVVGFQLRRSNTGPDVAAEEELKRRQSLLDRQRNELFEREKNVTRREKQLREATMYTGPKFGPATTSCILLTAGNGLLLVETHEEDGKLAASEIPEEYRKLLVGTHADTFRTLTLVRAYLACQVLNAERLPTSTEKERRTKERALSEANGAKDSFEAQLKEYQEQDQTTLRQAAAAERKATEDARKQASKPAPLATLADAQKAKDKERGNKPKAKKERNAPSTTEAPAPVPPPPTEPTPQPAAPQ